MLNTHTVTSAGPFVQSTSAYPSVTRYRPRRRSPVWRASPRPAKVYFQTDDRRIHAIAVYNLALEFGVTRCRQGIHGHHYPRLTTRPGLLVAAQPLTCLACIAQRPVEPR